MKKRYFKRVCYCLFSGERKKIENQRNFYLENIATPHCCFHLFIIKSFILISWSSHSRFSDDKCIFGFSNSLYSHNCGHKYIFLHFNKKNTATKYNYNFIIFQWLLRLQNHFPNNNLFHLDHQTPHWAILQKVHNLKQRNHFRQPLQ